MSLDPKAFKSLSRLLAPAAGSHVGDRAVEQELVSPAQLREAAAEQERSGKPLDQVLVERGFLRPEDAARLREPVLPPEAAEAAADPARRMKHYVLVALLGSGGMAEVWKAWDRSIGRWVAMKILKPGVDHALRRIERESRLAGQLSHPNIVPIFERGEHEGRPYLVMARVEGDPVKAPLPPAEAARVIGEAARALDHAHRNGVIHRDVKPGNLLVDAGGRVLLADFGLAMESETPGSTWSMTGTPSYASPEQIRGESLDPRTDVYSLGATLHQLLTGKAPFQGPTAEAICRRVLGERPPEVPGLPRRMARLLARMLEKDRERRPDSMEEVIREADALLRFRGEAGLSRRAWIGIGSAIALPWALLAIALVRGESDLVTGPLLRRMVEGERRLARAEQLREGLEAPRAAVESEAAAAAQAFEEALRVWGANPAAFLGLGRALDLLGRLSEAEAAFRSAGAEPGARLGLGRVLLRKHLEGRKDLDWRQQAKGVLDRALTLTAGESTAALLAYARGDAVSCLREASTAAERNRGDDVLWLCAGAAAIELSMWLEARLYLDQVLRLRRGDVVSRYWAGRALEGAGEREAAASAYEQALSGAPAGWPPAEDVRKRIESLRR